MANRYTYSKIVKTPETNESYLESTIYPQISAADNDIYILTDETDRLDLLAITYYRDPAMWWIIATANNLNDASMYIEPGTQLRIPTNVQKIMSDLSKLNK
jgi:hypothetical protein